MRRISLLLVVALAACAGGPKGDAERSNATSFGKPNSVTTTVME